MKIISYLASCQHKLLSATILVALLISANSQTSSAELGGRVSASGSSDLANSNAGSNSNSGFKASGSLGGVGGSLSLGGSSSAGASSSGSGSGSSLSAGSSSSSSISASSKPEGLFGKLKDAVKSTVGLNDGKQVSGSASASSSSSSIQGSSSGLSGSSSSTSASGSATVSTSNSDSLVGKIGGAISKGSEMVKDTARELKQDVLGGSSSSSSSASIKIGGNTGSGGVSGSVKIGGSSSSSSSSSSSASVSASAGSGSRKDEGIFSKIASKASEFSKEISQTKENVRSKLQDSPEDKSVAVQVLDKIGEVAKGPVENVLKPIDKVMGFQRDPLVKIYDSSRELLRKPVSEIAKPVEEVIGGAFKTSEESRKEAEKKMGVQERQLSKLQAERLKKGTGRSLLGEINDRAVELAQAPFEVVLRPFDRALGLDKDGKKSPLIRIFNSVYGLSRGPVDAVAKPFENILKKMADGDQAFQVSVRINPDSRADPKLITRIANGALNIADRIITKPIDLVMRPFGYGGSCKKDKNGQMICQKNPIVEAAHSLKNSTKLGIELFTKPLDRIIKEIAEIGAIKDDAQREAELTRKRQEASRIVRALDKFSQYAQMPFEFVLRPVGKILGYNREGRKEPLLQAWDVAQEVAMAPLQVLSKPVEDAILGERKPQPLSPSDKKAVHFAAAVGGPKKNVFVNGIKRAEKIVARPLEMVSSPIRRLILGKDGEVHSKAGSPNDSIVQTVQKLNNLALKPLAILTQPISDIISPDGKSVNVRASSSANGQQSQGKIEVKAQANVSTQQKSQQGSALSSSSASLTSSGLSGQSGSAASSASAKIQVRH